MTQKKLTLRVKLYKKFTTWMMRDTKKPPEILLSDFNQVHSNIQPCDVLLVEGRNRISHAISTLTRSPWTHAALCIGHYCEIKDKQLQQLIQHHYQGPFDEPLLIESYMTTGVSCVPLSKYNKDHVRICRPRGLHKPAAHKILSYVISKLGLGYDIRQIADLARFFFPWGLLFSRRWKTSLFDHHAGPPTRLTCSLLIIEAFSKVRFPVLPGLKKQENDFALVRRHPRLYTPTDFDFSPFFDVVKYPMLDLSDPHTYQNLPWSKEGEIKE